MNKLIINKTVVFLGRTEEAYLCERIDTSQDIHARSGAHWWIPPPGGSSWIRQAPERTLGNNFWPIDPVPVQSITVRSAHQGHCTNQGLIACTVYYIHLPPGGFRETRAFRQAGFFKNSAHQLINTNAHRQRAADTSALRQRQLIHPTLVSCRHGHASYNR